MKTKLLFTLFTFCGYFGYCQVPNNEVTDPLTVELTASNYSLIHPELRNTIFTYKTTISNTYFQIPIARFNLIDGDPTKKGDITLFTSIGAGVGYSWGRMEITRDDTGQITNEEFSNTFGFHLGVLFSAGTGEDTKNVFAPTFNISMLDFQLGVGYELGTVNTNQDRSFVTLSYGIPLYKLVKKGYRVWRMRGTPVGSRGGGI